MRIKHIIAVSFLCFGVVSSSFAQDSLLDILEKESSKKPQYTIATFQATRIQLGHSVQTRKKNTLEISAMTRYWNSPTHGDDVFIAEKMSARFALEYGFTDRFTFGAGYSTVNSITDVFGKYRLLRQQDNGKNKFSITLLQTLTHNGANGGSVYTGSYRNNSSFIGDSDRLAFTTQVLIARKFTRNFSFQIAPTFIKRNSVFWPNDELNHFAIGFGGRYKVGRHVSIASEYYYVANPIESIQTYGPFSLGVNWELSDLMLQFKMANTPHFVEDAFITSARRSFSIEDGSFYFGFHATYFIQF